MKKITFILVACLLALAVIGCSDDNETSSVKIVYNPMVHSGSVVSIYLEGKTDDVYERALAYGVKEVVVPLNAGNYEFYAPLSDGMTILRCTFQVRQGRQTRIIYADNFDVSVEY